MDYSKFDFTKFSKEKWQEIIEKIDGQGNYVDGVNPDFKIVDGEIIPFVIVKYVHETEVDGEDIYFLTFTAYDVSEKNIVRPGATKKWRKIMIEEFPLWYRSKLIKHLQFVKEQKIQQADEEYYKELEEIHNNYCN